MFENFIPKEIIRKKLSTELSSSGKTIFYLQKKIKAVKKLA
jgi:hypothetical protein